MIFFVDEDFRQLRALVSELAFRNIIVEVIPDADQAYDRLSEVKVSEVDLVLVDVMLAASPNEALSRYSRARTDDYHKTGLLLLDDLCEVNPVVFPSRAVYFTHANNGTLVAAVERSASQNKVPLLKKKDFNTAHHFGDAIEKLVAQIRGVKL